MRAAEILRRLGWRKCDKQRRINGRVQHIEQTLKLRTNTGHLHTTLTVIINLEDRVLI